MTLCATWRWNQCLHFLVIFEFIFLIFFKSKIVISTFLVECNCYLTFQISLTEMEDKIFVLEGEKSGLEHEVSYLHKSRQLDLEQFEIHRQIFETMRTNILALEARLMSSYRLANKMRTTTTVATTTTATLATKTARTSTAAITPRQPL